MGSYADFLKSLSDATYDDSEEGEMEEDESEDASAGAKEVSSFPLFFLLELLEVSSSQRRCSSHAPFRHKIHL